MKDHTLMQTIARANRTTDFRINDKPKTNGLIVDYYNVFRNLKKAFATYGGGNIENKDSKGEDTPAQEKDQLYVLLQEAINSCSTFCLDLDIDLTEIAQSTLVFSKIALFDAFANTILLKDEHKKQFIVYDNTIDALYDACKPEILGRRKDFPMAAIIHYLREVIDGKADRSDLDSAKRRISQLLNDSIVAEDNAATENKEAADPLSKYGIKEWKQVDLSKLNVERLKQEYKQAPYKNIEIADLRAFMEHKLQIMLARNVNRKPFAEKLQEIIDNYNAGITTQEDYFDDLIDFFQQMKNEDERAYREGLTEAELEIFDLLKKDNLAKDEVQKVKLAAKSLLLRLQEERPTVLINDWHKDTQTKLQVEIAIKKVLDDHLPVSYDRAIYSTKCTAVYNHFLTMAQNGQYKAYS